MKDKLLNIIIGNKYKFLAGVIIFGVLGFWGFGNIQSKQVPSNKQNNSTFSSISSSSSSSRSFLSSASVSVSSQNTINSEPNIPQEQTKYQDQITKSNTTTEISSAQPVKIPQDKPEPKKEEIIKTIESIPIKPTIPVTEKVVEPKPEIKSSSQSCNPDKALQMLQLLNVYRTENDKPTLALSPELNKIACEHSAWMTDTGMFSHTGINGTSPFERCSNAGTFCLAENIANNPTQNVSDFLEQFKNSPGHNTNMLRANYTEAGFGFDGNNVTQLFR